MRQFSRSVVIVGDMTAHVSCPNIMMAAAETLDSDDDETKDLKTAAELANRIITDSVRPHSRHGGMLRPY
jgi:hypothetical protein